MNTTFGTQMWAASVAPPACLLTMWAPCGNPGSMTMLAVPLSSLSTALSIRPQQHEKNNVSGMLMCFCVRTPWLTLNWNLHVVTFVLSCFIYNGVSLVMITVQCVKIVTNCQMLWILYFIRDSLFSLPFTILEYLIIFILELWISGFVKTASLNFLWSLKYHWLWIL